MDVKTNIHRPVGIHYSVSHSNYEGVKMGKIESGTRVIHNEHPNYGEGIVINVNEHSVAQVAWSGNTRDTVVNHTFIANHNTCFLSRSDERS